MIIEGRIINVDSDAYGQILIDKNGVIAEVGATLGTADLKTSAMIFPGFVDVHVHAREDASKTQTYKEDFRSMSEAAIHGGVTAVADMPNNRIVPATRELYQTKQDLARSSLVETVLYGVVLPGSEPLDGQIPYKAFMGPSVGDIFFSSFDELKETIGAFRGQSVSFHCEDPELLREREKARSHEERRPREAEIRAVQFALELTEEYDLKTKICHVSTLEALEKIIAARKRGVNVTAEVTPHHLYFDADSVNDSQRRLLQVNPPLRTKLDREALLMGLKTGGIDFLASDHAPHTIAEKKEGISGIPHLDTYGAVCTWLMIEHGFSPQDIARISSHNPGRFISNFSDYKYGRVAKGYIGSLTILDPSNPQRVRRQDLKTKCAWSPFEGVEFPGRVTHTIVKGKVYEN